MPDISEQLFRAAASLCEELRGLKFSPPTHTVYNPLGYAREPHETYLRRFGNSEKRVLLLGMNPGPWGMAQTGVPFGEIPAVRDWMGIEAPVGKPEPEHPKRPIEGFGCRKSEVSGRRLWGLFAERFGDPDAFFADHFVVNFCPLVWMEESGRNRTPDKLPAAELAPVTEACDRCLRSVIEILRPEFAVGVGGFAEKCLIRILGEMQSDPAPIVGRILHPSPASPAANRDWAGTATRQLIEQGIWSDS